MKILKKFMSLFLLTQVLMLWVNPVDAQYEWAPIGAKWYMNDVAYASGYLDPNLWNNYTLVECTGDTTIGGHAGRIVGDWIMIQDGYKVYVWWEDTLRLQYDFSLEIGDTATFHLLDKSLSDYLFRPYSFIVEDIDTINVNGHDLNMFYTKGNDHPDQPDSWYWWEYVYMEKLGSINTIVEEAAFLIPTADHFPAFIRCYEDEDLLWKHDWFVLDCDYSKPSTIHFPLLGSVSISPNPARSVIHLRVDAPLPHSSEIRVNILGSDGVVQLSMPLSLSNQTMDIPVSALAPGIYFLQLNDSAGHVLGVEKVVIE